MLRLALLCMATLLGGCVTQEIGADGVPVQRGKSAEIVTDAAGRIIARPTLLIAPHTIIVNGGLPTEREIRLLGVEGLPQNQAPNTFAECQAYMARWVAGEEQIFIKPALSTDVRERVIYGIVYLQAYEQLPDGSPGRMLPDGYTCLNQAMLSLGLVKMRDPREIDDERLRASMIEIEKQAKAKRLGLWAASP